MEKPRTADEVWQNFYDFLFEMMKRSALVAALGYGFSAMVGSQLLGATIGLVGLLLLFAWCRVRVRRLRYTDPVPEELGRYDRIPTQLSDLGVSLASYAACALATLMVITAVYAADKPSRLWDKSGHDVHATQSQKASD